MTVLLFEICAGITLTFIVILIFDFIREAISWISTAIYLKRKRRKFENIPRTQNDLCKGLLINEIYTVQNGDCLWNIAKKVYGSGSSWESWKKIAEANQIDIPYSIYPGQELKIPFLEQEDRKRGKE